jgi:hypothetical protein
MDYLHFHHSLYSQHKNIQKLRQLHSKWNQYFANISVHLNLVCLKKGLKKLLS